MTWSLVRKWLRKTGAWLVGHWQFLIGALVAILVMMFFRRGTPDFTALYKAISERVRKEQDDVEEAYQTEIRLQEAATERAADALRQVEREYEERKEELDAKKKREVKRVIESAKADPEELAKKLAALTGVTYVPGSDR